MPDAPVTLPQVPWLYVTPPVLDAPRADEFHDNSIQSALDSFGLNWHALRRRVWFDRPSDSTFQPVPRHHAIVRGDNETLLGLVGHKLDQCDHIAAFQSLAPLLGGQGLSILDAGVIYGGQKAVLRCVAPFEPVGDTELKLVIAFVVGHLGANTTAFHVFARNATLGFDIPLGHNAWTVGGSDGIMIFARDRRDALVSKMINTETYPARNDTGINDYFSTVYLSSSVRVKRVRHIYDHLLQFYSPGIQTAFQAVCVHEDYKVYHAAKEQDRRVDEALFGLGAKVKMRALNLMAE